MSWCLPRSLWVIHAGARKSTVGAARDGSGRSWASRRAARVAGRLRADAAVLRTDSLLRCLLKRPGPAALRREVAAGIASGALAARPAGNAFALARRGS